MKISCFSRCFIYLKCYLLIQVEDEENIKDHFKIVKKKDTKTILIDVKILMN